MLFGFPPGATSSRGDGRVAVEFGVLGDVEARVDGRLVDLGHARQRCVLAALLVDAGRAVPVDQLLDRVWGQHVLHSALDTLRSYLSRLRQALAAATEVDIARRPGGYVLAIDPMTVDSHRFRRLTTQARAAEDDQAAAVLFEQALGLWRGEAFGTLDTPWLNEVRAALDRQRLAAELDRNDLALRCVRSVFAQSIRSQTISFSFSRNRSPSGPPIHSNHHGLMFTARYCDQSVASIIRPDGDAVLLPATERPAVAASPRAWRSAAIMNGWAGARSPASHGASGG
jgi:DNA-binding winged helix-turn-helix (wHTH) protein